MKEVNEVQTEHNYLRLLCAGNVLRDYLEADLNAHKPWEKEIDEFLSALDCATNLKQRDKMKHINEELEGNTPRWDSNLGRWIEPEEVLDTGAESTNESSETDEVLYDGNRECSHGIKAKDFCEVCDL